MPAVSIRILAPCEPATENRYFRIRSSGHIKHTTEKPWQPLCLLGGVSFTTVSSIKISPLVGVSSPAIIRMVVVFPHPDGPSNTKNSWSLISKEVSFTA